MHPTLQREIDHARQIMDSAKDLLAATADSAEDQVRYARERLRSTLASSRDVFDQISYKANDVARATDRQIRQNPYVPVFIALGLGLILSAVVIKNSIGCCKRDEFGDDN